VCSRTGSKGTKERHVDLGKPPDKEHVKVKNNLGATAIYGARKDDNR
jgi:hypothetical protein